MDGVEFLWFKILWWRQPLPARDLISLLNIYLIE